MGQQGRRPRARPIVGLGWASLLVAAALAILGAVSAQARELSVSGTPMSGFGRILLGFDETTKVTVRASGTVLVIGFANSARIAPEKLADQLPAYVGTVRRDPDGTGLRLALTQPFRFSVLEAGERVFVDLLPAKWVGLPPGLPPDVVAELAERARTAEAKLKADEARRLGARAPVRMRLARLPGRTRLVFEPPPGTPTRTAEPPGGGLEAVFEGHLVLETGGEKPKAEAGIAEFAAREDGRGVAVRVSPSPGFKVLSFPEDGSLVLDVIGTAAAAATPALPEPAPRPPEPPPAPARDATPAKVAVAQPPAEPSRTGAPASAPPLPSPSPSPPGRNADAIRPTFRRDGNTAALAFPFRHPTGAGAFERGGRLTVVFHSPDRVLADELPETERAAFGLLDLRREGDFTILTIRQDADAPARLLPDGPGWTVKRGGAGLDVPPDDLVLTRSGDADGRTDARVSLAGGTAVHWLLSPDDVPLAVATAPGRQAVAAERRLVEFTLLPTVQGVVVQPGVDGIRVALARGGVAISRPGGLSLSSVGQDGGGAVRLPLVITAEGWHRDRAGDVLAALREKVAAASEAAKAGRADARLALARAFLANGLSHEAASVLGLAAGEDAVVARRRDLLLLSGVAALRARRFREGRAFLVDEALAGDPEAQLWRAALDAEARDWPKALAGIRRADPVLSRYPDELAGEFRLLAVRAAAESGDVGAAEAALAAIEQLPPGALDHNRTELHRAMVEAAAGRTVLALRSFERLAADAPPPVAAEAALRAVLLGRASGRMADEDATSRLETLALGWRGDAVELGALAQLAASHGEAGRWREMLATARLVDRRFPSEALTRQVHADTARRFEALFLGPDAARLDPVEVLGLFYDFREFSPAGRRGDEIVRRIADRLVEIDLLDQAAALLQHQVDNRLSGMARTVIATRLAALRLMGGKPALALEALRGSRMADVTGPLRRLRLLIEAQALADQTRTDLALEIVDGEDGADFARLRATVLFSARRWREAGEAYEGLLGLRWREGEALTAEERQDVIRAALADALAEEWLALGRLRGKFAARMADSPDAKTFEMLLRPRSAEGPDFRAALKEASRAASLRRFLADWSRIADLPPTEPDVAENAGAGPGRG